MQVRAVATLLPAFGRSQTAFIFNIRNIYIYIYIYEEWDVIFFILQVGLLLALHSGAIWRLRPLLCEAEPASKVN